MSSDILKFTEDRLIDESIEQYEYHKYQPVTGANLNSNCEITINIESQDLFTHPSESYLIFQGRLTKANGTAYANADLTLTNNGIMYLFNRISYYLSNQEIKTVSYPCQVNTQMILQRHKVSISCGTKTQRPRQF